VFVGMVSHDENLWPDGGGDQFDYSHFWRSTRNEKAGSAGNVAGIRG
jgi:hypothetical protein